MRSTFLNLSSKKGDGLLIQVITYMLFAVIIFIISIDIYSFYQQGVYTKNILNRAVKAAATQVNTDLVDENGENLAAKGIFIVDEIKARNTFNEILADNLKETVLPDGTITYGVEVLDLIVFPKDYDEYKANPLPKNYRIDHLEKEYLVEHPGVFVICKYKVQSLFLKRELVFSKMSSAELIS